MLANQNSSNKQYAGKTKVILPPCTHDKVESRMILNKIIWLNLVVSDGALEALKWLALLLMTVNHDNKFLFNGTNYAAFAAGPLLVFLSGIQPPRLGAWAYLLTMRRLAIYGFLTMPPPLFLMGSTCSYLY